MAGSDDPRDPSRPRRDQFDGLRRLGGEMQGPKRSRREAPLGSGAPRDSVANQQGLDSLGAAIDEQRPRRRRRSAHRYRRRVVAVVGVVLVVLLAFLGGSYWYLSYRYGQIHKVTVSDLTPTVSGQPINLLVIGSDSRSGLTGSMAAQAGASQVTGQRSDVDQIWHLDPGAGTVQIISIPRDTLVSMGTLANQEGRFNRINTAYGNGPAPLVNLIQSNFGIPINHVIQVSFDGFVGATNALGGVWMNFPYPAQDAYSGLNITKPGCQLLDGTQALAVARSRHFEYEVNGQWLSDGTSDFGRIHRQGTFLRSLVDAAKSKVSPFTLNAFLGSLPAGVTLDSSMSLLDVLDLGYHFHSLNPATISTQTLPTTSIGAVDPWGDVLFVDQPAAQQMLVSVFGSQLMTPSTPPPNTSLESVPPPTITPTTQPPTAPPSSGGGAPAASPTATTTTLPPFDPTPCSPA